MEYSAGHPLVRCSRTPCQRCRRRALLRALGHHIYNGKQAPAPLHSSWLAVLLMASWCRLLRASVLHDGDHLLELRPVLATEPYADLRREGIVAQYHARLMAISLAAGNTTRAIRVVDSLEVAGVLWRVGSHDVASSRRTAARLTVSSGSGYRSNSSGSRHIRGSYW